MRTLKNTLEVNLENYIAFFAFSSSFFFASRHDFYRFHGENLEDFLIVFKKTNSFFLNYSALCLSKINKFSQKLSFSETLFLGA